MTAATSKPVIPRPAATVVLVRDGAEGLEVYLLKRSAKSGFMPGHYVFPGGAVDTQDEDARFWRDHVDLGPAEISERLDGNLPLDEILSYAVAVVRETLEEAGVFLGRRCSEVRGRLAEVRRRRLDGGLSPEWLRELVDTGDWQLSLSGLGRWSHWVTPEAMPKRYDTRFFLAFAPWDQECAPDAYETTHGGWLSPEAALRGNLEGKVILSPPTLSNLHDLLAFRDMAALKTELDQRPWGPPRSPRPLLVDHGVLNILPWDPMFDRTEDIDASALDDTPLPVGAPFSRVLLKEGIWRPVA
ncbi:MAG: hypothetical protein JRF65_03800 [Deltaproteobacteria bacterium]|nr:hypothetical protein [Deltaproteobacteria bacterium]